MQPGVSIPVALSAAVTKTVTIDYIAAGGSATNTVDYVLANGTLTFAPGETTKTILFNVQDDSFSEGDETIVITLVVPFNTTLGEFNSHTYTVLDNEPAPPPVPEGRGLRSEYYDTIDLTGPVLLRNDAAIDFDWGKDSPDPTLGINTFSARWTGWLEPQFTETYTFYLLSDDGARLWVNNQLLVNAWGDQPPLEHQGQIVLFAGQRVPIKVEYFENEAEALMHLSWSSASIPKGIIPPVSLFPPDGTIQATVDPNPARVNQPVNFVATALEAEGVIYTYTWAFGDGTTGSGSTLQHSYLTADTYPVTLTVISNTGVETVLSMTVLIVNDVGGDSEPPVPPGNGPSNDFDGDGVPNNEDEDSDGDGVPNSADLDPFTRAPISALKVSGSMKFNTAGKDAASVMGTLPSVAKGFVPTGVNAWLDVGGVLVNYTFDAKGKAKNADGSMQFRLKLSRDKATNLRFFAGGDVPFKAKIPKGAWSEYWLDEGADPSVNAKNQAFPIQINLTMNGTSYGGIYQSKYTGKAGVGGKFK